MHIMIDLETMGTRADAPIVSIGAVAFDAKGLTESSIARCPCTALCAPVP